VINNAPHSARRPSAEAYEEAHEARRAYVFLAEMAAVVPWSVLESLVEPHYPKVGPQGGRRPFPITVMLRIYCLQQWYQPSDPGAEEALYDIQSMRALCNLTLGRDPIPVKNSYFRIGDILEYYSRWLTFQPGDIISRGNPAGVGFAQSPQLFLKSGDRIEMEARGIGRMDLPVVAE